MKKHKRLFAALLVLAVAIVMLSSAVYIAVQADHDCTGTDCQICYHIASCQQTLKQAALTGSAAAACRCCDLCPVWRSAMRGEAVCLVYTGITQGKTIQLNTGMCLGVKSAHFG